MSIPQWSDHFKVGIEEIDFQHKRIFDTLLMLEEGIRMNQENSILEQILVDLEEYAREHFMTEELSFDKFHYPEAESHRRAHQRFIDVIQLFRALMENNKLNALSVSEYMKSWIYQHVLIMDMQFKVYLEKQFGGGLHASGAATEAKPEHAH